MAAAVRLDYQTKCSDLITQMTINRIDGLIVWCVDSTACRYLYSLIMTLDLIRYSFVVHCLKGARSRAVEVDGAAHRDDSSTNQWQAMIKLQETLGTASWLPIFKNWHLPY